MFSDDKHVHYWGGLSSRWFFINVIFHQGGLSLQGVSLGWSFIRMVFDQGGVPLRLSFIRMVFDQGGLPLRWYFMGGLSSGWFHQDGL